MEGNKNLNEINSFNLDSEIDLIQIYKFFVRNKKSILIFSAIGFFLGILFSLSTKKIWQGQFQIVLPNKGKNQSSLISNFLSRSNIRSNLNISSIENNPVKTEVEILKSSSVLKPAFDFFKEEKKKKGENMDKLEFLKWQKSNLKVDLVKGTSVLTLIYKDTDKDIIMPILNNISDSYQKYSSKERNQNLSKSIKYLTRQIEIYKEKSKKSFLEAKQFALENNLSNDLFMNFRSNSNLNNAQKLGGNFSQSSSFQNDINQLKIRINHLENQRKSLKVLNDNEIRLFALNLPNFKTSELFRNIESINKEIISRSTVYKDNDEILKYSKNLRKDLINKLREDLINYLDNQILISNSLKKSVERPNSVILKYFELSRNAERDTFTLNGLEDSLRLNSLEQSKISEPWKLISLPTVNSTPSGISKSSIALSGLLLGAFLSFIYSFVKEKKSGIIFNSNEFRQLIPYEMIGQIDPDDLLKRESQIEVISKITYLKESKNKVSLKFLDEDNTNLKDMILESLNKNLDKFYIEEGKVNNIKEAVKEVLIVSLKYTRRESLINYIRESSLTNKNVLGWIIITNKSSL